MYDSLITLIQLLDNSNRKTSLSIEECELLGKVVEVKLEGELSYTYPYTQDGISEAIEELENLV